MLAAETGADAERRCYWFGTGCCSLVARLPIFSLASASDWRSCRCWLLLAGGRSWCLVGAGALGAYSWVFLIAGCWCLCWIYLMASLLTSGRLAVRACFRSSERDGCSCAGCRPCGVVLVYGYGVGKWV
jgi:hypothetical protein